MADDSSDSGFNWSGLSDFINSVEAPTLGIISVARGGSVSTASGPNGTTLSATATGNGTFAPGTGTTGSDLVSAGLARPGLILIALAAVVVVVALSRK